MLTFQHKNLSWRGTNSPTAMKDTPEVIFHFRKRSGSIRPLYNNGVCVCMEAERQTLQRVVRWAESTIGHPLPFRQTSTGHAASAERLKSPETACIRPAPCSAYCPPADATGPSGQKPPDWGKAFSTSNHLTECPLIAAHLIDWTFYLLLLFTI